MSRRLPDWLRPVAPKAHQLATMGRRLAASGINTVCQSARCPNVGECFGSGNAAFMILGDACTRNCGFCAVGHSAPQPLDLDEPQRVAVAAKALGLRYVVITSVTRDDLPDGGAGHFAATVSAVRQLLPAAGVEVLVPDFQGDIEALGVALNAVPTVFGHNMETVQRLYPQVRPQADYARSLKVLRGAGERAPQVVIKSGFMVGLGETETEVVELLHDLRDAGVSAVTIGQYLQPTRDRLPVAEYVRPETFTRFEEQARRMGFRYVMSGPLVRSSYHAADLVES
jgi:lipoic acid synthetase